MNRLLLGTVVSALVVVSAPAWSCETSMFVVTDWRASVSESGRHIRTDVEVDLIYQGSVAYRMIHAATLFSDAIGNALVSVQLERDQAVKPGDALTVSGAFLGEDSRITSINRDDVRSRTCVWSIVYNDGTVEEFQ